MCSKSITIDKESLIKLHEAYIILQKIFSEGGVDENSQTLGDFIKEVYMPHAKSKKRSWKTEAGIIRRYILPILGTMGIRQIKRLDIVKWQEGMVAKEFAASTCNRALATLKYIFNCAVKWEIIKQSPCSQVMALPEGEQKGRYLSQEEASALLDVLKKEKNRQAARAIQLLLLTGARKSEILNARWENVDLVNNILTVPLSKSGKTRYIPLSDAAIAVIQDIPRVSEWLFPSPRTDNAISSVFDVWDKSRKEAGVDKTRLHDLRHTFASFLVNSGCSLYEVQKILGHYNPKVTMRYAHLTQSRLLGAVNKIGGKLCC